jgi:tetratricopeptide (TPR) repeat protein
MKYRILFAAAAWLIGLTWLPAQAKKLSPVAPGSKLTIAQMVDKGQIEEAVKLAVEDPLAAEAAMNSLMGTIDTHIVNRKIAEALTLLGSAQSFVDACDKTGQIKRLPREALMGRHFRVQGIMLNDQKEFAKAVEMLRQALRVSQNAQDSALEAGIRNNLGYALQNQQLLSEASKEYDAARKIAEDQKDDLRAGSYNFNLGTALLAMSQNDTAAAAFKRSAAQNKNAGRASLEARAVLMQGVAAGKASPKSEEAMKLLVSAEAMFEKIGDHRNAGWSYLQMGSLKESSMDYQKAAEYTEKALPFLTKAEDKAGLLGCYELLQRMYGFLNDKVKAENYQKLAAGLATKK